MPRNPFIVKLSTPSTNGPARLRYVHVLCLLRFSLLSFSQPPEHAFPLPCSICSHQSPPATPAQLQPSPCHQKLTLPIDWGSFDPAHVAHHRIVPEQLVHHHPSPSHLRCPVGGSLPRTSRCLFQTRTGSFVLNAVTISIGNIDRPRDVQSHLQRLYRRTDPPGLA